MVVFRVIRESSMDGLRKNTRRKEVRKEIT
jgi:hypothetical protein